jgi:hypothetical protein
MKKFYLIPIFLLMCDFGFAQFEGTLVMSIKSYQIPVKDKDTSQQASVEKIKFYLGLNDFKIESGDENLGGSFIISLSTKMIIMLSDSDKSYSELPFSFFKMASEGMKELSIIDSGSTKSVKKSNLKRTNEKKRIEGIECTKYEVLEENKTIEAWVALKFTNFFKSFTEVGSEILAGGGKYEFEDIFVDELSDKGGFPLYMIEKDKEGNIISESIVSVIDKTKFEKSFFKPPKGYKSMKLDNIR